MFARAYADDAKKLTDDELLEMLNHLGADDVFGLPLHDISFVDGSKLRGALTALGVSKEDLVIFLVEGSDDLSFPFDERLTAWREERLPGARAGGGPSSLGGGGGGGRGGRG